MRGEKHTRKQEIEDQKWNIRNGTSEGEQLRDKRGEKCTQRQIEAIHRGDTRNAMIVLEERESAIELPQCVTSHYVQ